ncbi:MAG: sulfotransferase [Vicingaceae bacterium]
MSQEQPLIVVGMHRSGTTMLIKLIEQLGVFVGDKKRHNYEATFFQEINRWLLQQANCFWDNPEHFQFVDEVYFREVERVLEKRLSSLALTEYLGLSKTLQTKSLFKADFHWAWKDPANSITWPVWLDLFPNAKFIHIYRNPFDVALSLQQRELKRGERFKIDWKKKLKERFLIRGFQYQESYRIKKEEEGVELWKSYLQSIKSLKAKLPSEQYLEFKYEEFTVQPIKSLQLLKAYLNIEVSKDKLSQIAGQVHQGSRHNYLTNPKGLDLYEKYKEDKLIVEYQYNKQN